MPAVGTKGRRAAIVEELHVPVPFGLSQFVTELERQRRRPIHLRPFTSGPGVPCGLWIGTVDADYIYHEAGTTPFHATHIAVHELAHMLLRHQHTAAWDEIVALLAPEVDQALVQLILGRSAYSTIEEREAETLASLILSSAATAWLAAMSLPCHPLDHSPRQSHPPWRQPGDLLHDMRPADRPAHRDERDRLGPNIVSDPGADVYARNIFAAIPGLTLAASDRVDDSRRLHDYGSDVR
jgi:hypothetical protein